MAGVNSSLNNSQNWVTKTEHVVRKAGLMLDQIVKIQNVYQPNWDVLKDIPKMKEDDSVSKFKKESQCQKKEAAKINQIANSTIKLRWQGDKISKVDADQYMKNMNLNSQIHINHDHDSNDEAKHLNSNIIQNDVQSNHLKNPKKRHFSEINVQKDDQFMQRRLAHNRSMMNRNNLHNKPVVRDGLRHVNNIPNSVSLNNMYNNGQNDCHTTNQFYPSYPPNSVFNISRNINATNSLSQSTNIFQANNQFNSLQSMYQTPVRPNISLQQSRTHMNPFYQRRNVIRNSFVTPQHQRFMLDVHSNTSMSQFSSNVSSNFSHGFDANSICKQSTGTEKDALDELIENLTDSEDQSHDLSESVNKLEISLKKQSEKEKNETSLRDESKTGFKTLSEISPIFCEENRSIIQSNHETVFFSNSQKMLQFIVAHDNIMGEWFVQTKKDWSQNKDIANSLIYSCCVKYPFTIEYFNYITERCEENSNSGIKTVGQFAPTTSNDTQENTSSVSCQIISDHLTVVNNVNMQARQSKEDCREGVSCQEFINVQNDNYNKSDWNHCNKYSHTEQLVADSKLDECDKVDETPGNNVPAQSSQMINIDNISQTWRKMTQVKLQNS